ncbi:MAG TPA: choice-of-anchor P family protein [Gaiellaceae bacterium]|nr:choice-of-anchor P family protein [Gaiellaceae bacterium]
MIRLALVVVVAVVASATLAAAAPPPKSATTGANAFLVRITVPGQDTISLGELDWLDSTTVDVQSFQYPGDGSVLSVGRSRASVFAAPGSAAATQAVSEVIVVSLFGGEIVAGKVTASVSAGASVRSVGSQTSASEVQGLRALDRDIPSTPGSSASLEDWGTLTVLSTSAGTRKKGPPAAAASVTALRVHLTAAHGGLPAGSEIVIGQASATSVADVSAPPPTAKPGTTPKPATPRARPVTPAPEPDVGGEVPGGPVKVAPEVSARLSSGGFVFPIYGTASFGDSFGAPRPDVVSGWHHGEDVFAAAGTPLLAVADGTLHTIGFNRLGGYRLWLRDTDGDEFYYAHLSAYSPLAVEGRKVEAGDVIGFVGDTGDADGGAPHLHFEIHPASMLGLGYDGVVAPYSILLAWRRAADISFSAGRVYTPTGPGSTELPPPGAVLLEADDIASTSGLVPGALEKVLKR